MADMLHRLKKALKDRYTIERKIGAGGAATVYLARDLKHDRMVAAKVLRPKLSASMGVDRFLREIKIAAKLNHPHILPLHDSGEAGGFLFFVMPYVEGESLRDRIGREGQLPVDDALAITTQVADALRTAHRQGVVHRDIKPENILLSDGHALIADFGIALAVTAAQDSRLTGHGLALGTPAYMSPEQVYGDSNIDGRSDIYSLACVLYEMLSGEPPFTGASAQAILARHMTAPIPPISAVRSSVPSPVAAAITKALGKSPEERFESASAFSRSLRAAAPDREPDVKSIVVLPFQNLSPDPDQDHFSDGLTEEVISDLSRVGSLRVISRSSAMTFKGSNKRLSQIADELNVRFALEGSVRKAGDSLRISAQLVDAAEDVHLWADKYTGTLEDVFDMQEKVSRAIVDALKVKLTPEAEASMAHHTIDDARAFDCHLRARYQFLLGTREALDHAEQLIKNGLGIIGDNELLFADLGHLYCNHYEFISKSDKVCSDNALEYAKKVFALNPDSPHGHFLLGRVHLLLGETQAAAKELNSVLALDPKNSDALGRLAWLYATAGHVSSARPLAKTLLEVDPLIPINHLAAGGVEWMGGEFGTALQHLQKAHEMERQVPIFRYWYAMAHAYAQDMDGASVLFDTIVAETPNNIFGWLAAFFLQAAAGDKTEALECVTDEFVQTAREDEIYPIWMAECYALLGEIEEAINWIEHVVDFGFANHRFLSEYDPFLYAIRGEHRFGEAMMRAQQKSESFEVNNPATPACDAGEEKGAG